MARLWLIPVSLLLLLLLAYAGTDPAPRADFVYVNTSDVHTLDPARMSWTPDFRVALNIWEGLTSWDPRSNRAIGAAAHFPPDCSDDGLTWRFTLREDARWSNGDPVTSHDFVRGWRRSIEPGSAADYAFLITRHLAGAADYARWRQQGVAVLTALDRLCRGAGATDRERATLESSPLYRWFRERISRNHSAAAASEGDLAKHPSDAHDVAAEAASAWCAQYDEFFELHLAEMEARFLAVGLETPDDRTLVVHLAQPAPYFLDVTGLPVFLPCHRSIERLRVRHKGAPITRHGLLIYDPQWTKPDYTSHGYPGLVSNGPFRLVDWTFKRGLRLEVNPFHRAAPDIAARTVEMRVYDNVNAALMAFEAGDVDFLPGVPVAYDYEIARLARSGKRPDFHLCDVLATYFLVFNCADATVNGKPNPFVDVTVRRAFALSVDKDSLVHRVLARGDRVARSFVPPGVIEGYEPPTAPEYDPTRARQILVDRGYGEMSSFPVVEILCTQRDLRVVQAVARKWENALGVHVILRSLESRTYADEKAARRFMIATGNWYGDYFDPTTFLDCLSHDSGNNDAGYVNEVYDALLNEARNTADPERRMRILADAERLMVSQDMPLVPIFHYVETVAIRPRISGIHPNPRMWFPFQHVRIGR